MSAPRRQRPAKRAAEPSFSPFTRVQTTVAGLSLPGHCLRRPAAPFAFESVGEAQRRAIARGLLGALVTPPAGVGLAAPMVGLDWRLVVMLDDRRVFLMANPEIVASEGEATVATEGNLCLPGVAAQVSRPETVVVRWQDMQRRQHEDTFSGWPARILQHEIEILDGVMFTDHAEAAAVDLDGPAQRAARVVSEVFADAAAPPRPVEEVAVVSLPSELLGLEASVLRRAAADVDFATVPPELLRALIQAMLVAQYRRSGVGMAAPQAGVGLRIAVIDDHESPDQPPLVLINPRVLERGEQTDHDRESCFSVPGRRGPVERATAVRVLNHSPSGEPSEIELDGHLARVVQHEIDHLDGTLYTDLVPRGETLTVTDPDTRARNAYRLAGLP